MVSNFSDTELGNEESSSSESGSSDSCSEAEQ